MVPTRLKSRHRLLLSGARSSYGAEAIRLAIDEVEQMADITIFRTNIKRENMASISAFNNAGFVEPVSVTYGGQSALQMSYRYEVSR